MMKNISLKEYIDNIPKAELHLHIEGSFEPELMFEISRRNNVPLKYNSVDELKTAYNFGSLQDFLDIYYAGANALQTEHDFYDLTWAYLEKAHSQNIVHTEIMFDPQTHTERGVKFSAVIEGIHRALSDAEKEFGMSHALILSFLRHLSEESAFETLRQAIDYKEWISFVGLDSSEVGNPPVKFKNIFEEAKKIGFALTAHAGEEGPPEYVWEALDILNVERIDHGNRSLEDEKLIERLVDDKMALTVCPLSNLKLRVVDDMSKHPLRTMMDKGLLVTINSDDPAYFGGYVNENYYAVADALDLSEDHIFRLVKNSFEASFLESGKKRNVISRLESFHKA